MTPSLSPKSYEVWINGFGEVVEAKFLPKFPDTDETGPNAADYKARIYDYKNGFEKDARYKQMYCMNYHPEIFKHIFPLDTSAKAALQYLEWVLDQQSDTPTPC